MSGEEKKVTSFVVLVREGKQVLLLSKRFQRKIPVELVSSPMQPREEGL